MIGAFLSAMTAENHLRACYVDVNNPDQRETACYAWHGTRPSHRLGMRPSLLAQGPGDLCLKRRTIKSLSLRFWLSSSRSLGRCLLLGQRSPMNLHTVRPYIPHTSLSMNGKSSMISKSLRS